MYLCGMQYQRCAFLSNRSCTTSKTSEGGNKKENKTKQKGKEAAITSKTVSEKSQLAGLHL